MRGLGVVRSDGWLGGVCAGVANRIGIDPLIVRGIVVVAAILGAPMLLLYAAAWALLPDRENRIHLQRLFDGDFQPAIVGIGVLALLSLLPWAPGIWWANGGFWGSPSLGDVIGRVLWTLIVLALIAGLVVWAVRGNWGRDAWGANRGTGAGASAGAGAGASASASASASESATPAADAAASAAPGPGVWVAAAAGASTVPEPASAEAGATPDAPTVPLDPVAGKPALDTTAEPTEPPAPTVGASTQDVADWRARHASWQAEHAQWKARLDEDMRAVKRQRAAEMRAQAAAATAEAAAQRRAFRAANPRVGAAFGWATVGLALVAAAVVSAVWEPATGLTGYGVTAALAAATLVFGVAVLIAGLARRRSGFLIFLGIVLAVATLISGWVPRDKPFVFEGVHFSSMSAQLNDAQLSDARINTQEQGR
jgi:phage shock protein PspC (stress-responsive transcriptional regulator)